MNLDAILKSYGAVEALLEDWSRAARRPVSLEGLIGQWRRLIDRAEVGYRLSLDDYLNDVEAREMLDKALQASHGELAAELAAALMPLDERFVAATEVSDALGRVSPWSARVPRKMGHEMRAQLQDLERARRREWK